MNIIELSGNRYEVKGNGNYRSVKLDGEWITTEQFIDHLIENKETAQLAELCVFGHNKITEL